MDARGGAPLSDDVRLLAEAVADGGVERGEDFARFLNEVAGADGVADVFDFVVGLFRALALDRGEIGRQVGDETGGHVVGDEFGDGGGILQVAEESGGTGEDFSVGVVAEAEVGGKSWFRAGDGAGGAGNGFKVFPDFREQVVAGPGGGAGGDAGNGIVREDVGGDLRGAGEPGDGIAANREGGSMGDSEAVDASEGLVNGVVFIVHGFSSWCFFPTTAGLSGRWVEGNLQVAFGTSEVVGLKGSRRTRKSTGKRRGQTI